MSIASITESLDLEMKIRDVEVLWVANDKYEWATVRAKKDFSNGEVIEVDPIVILSQKDSRIVRKTRLRETCYKFEDKLVIPGGYGPIYGEDNNASFYEIKDNNASYTVVPEARALVITADRKILEGEFIYVNGRWDHVNFGDFSSKQELKSIEKSPWKAEGLVVRPSHKGGLGTFTERRFNEGDLVEVCHLNWFSERESKILSKTKVERYMYALGSRNQLSGWAVGYPCFYNHSEEPNIFPWGQLESITEACGEHLAVMALKDLEPGTELVFDYLEKMPEKRKRKLLGFKPK